MASLATNPTGRTARLSSEIHSCKRCDKRQRALMFLDHDGAEQPICVLCSFSQSVLERLDSSRSFTRDESNRVKSEALEEAAAWRETIKDQNLILTDGELDAIHAAIGKAVEEDLSEAGASDTASRLLPTSSEKSLHTPTERALLKRKRRSTGPSTISVQTYRASDKPTVPAQTTSSLPKYISCGRTDPQGRCPCTRCAIARSWKASYANLVRRYSSAELEHQVRHYTAQTMKSKEAEMSKSNTQYIQLCRIVEQDVKEYLTRKAEESSSKPRDTSSEMPVESSSQRTFETDVGSEYHEGDALAAFRGPRLRSSYVAPTVADSDGPASSETHDSVAVEKTCSSKGCSSGSESRPSYYFTDSHQKTCFQCITKHRVRLHIGKQPKSHTVKTLVQLAEAFVDDRVEDWSNANATSANGLTIPRTVIDQETTGLYSYVGQYVSKKYEADAAAPTVDQEPSPAVDAQSKTRPNSRALDRSSTSGSTTGLMKTKQPTSSRAATAAESLDHALVPEINDTPEQESSFARGVIRFAEALQDAQRRLSTDSYQKLEAQFRSVKSEHYDKAADLIRKAIAQEVAWETARAQEAKEIAEVLSSMQ